jgi:hypothetical protein
MPGARLVAIHQPNFLPWLGFFDKLVRSDVFVLLDSVQFPKKGGNWTNRVQILVDGAAHWMTLPVVRAYHGTRAILDMRIDESTDWQGAHLDLLQRSYQSASCFGEVFPLLQEAISYSADLLAEYNVHAIRTLCDALGVPTDKLRRSSELAVPGASNELLINITRAVGGSAYLTGSGALDYLDPPRFEEAGIELVHQSFQHPIYAQGPRGSFVPGLSVVDALMHCGRGGVRSVLAPRGGEDEKR